MSNSDGKFPKVDNNGLIRIMPSDPKIEQLSMPARPIPKDLAPSTPKDSTSKPNKGDKK